MGRAKVTVVGAGFVGAATAQRLIEKEIADVVLVDIVDGLAARDQFHQCVAGR